MTAEQIKASWETLKGMEPEKLVEFQTEIAELLKQDISSCRIWIILVAEVLSERIPFARGIEEISSSMFSLGYVCGLAEREATILKKMYEDSESI